jgi:hypothetical protein
MIYFGEVEEINDPLYLGRVKVRVVGVHTGDSNALSTSDLPWSTPIRSNGSASIFGICESTSLMVGSTVVVSPVDNTLQDFLILGSIAGIPQRIRNYTGSSKQKGFTGAKSPKWIEEPETSRLERGMKLDDTYLKAKEDTRTKEIELANGKGKWEEPVSAYGSKYPDNFVKETKSGHVIEIDDTEGAERIHVYHKSGTYIEIDKNGRLVTKTKSNNFMVVEGDDALFVDGKMDVTVSGSHTFFVKGNADIQVDGSVNANVGNDLNVNVSGKTDIAGKEDIKLFSEGSLYLEAKGDIHTNAGGSFKASAGSTVDIKSESSMKIGSGSSMDINSSGTMKIDYSFGDFGNGASMAGKASSSGLGSPEARKTASEKQKGLVESSTKKPEPTIKQKYLRYDE